MAKLNDTQLMLLSAASQRRDFSVYPLPKSVKVGDGPKYIKKLLSLHMIEEAEAIGDAPVWRVREDGGNVTLILADAGFKALSLEREVQQAKKKVPIKSEPNNSPQRTGSKQSTMIALLQRMNGATIDELAEATGWQRHSVYGFMSGVLRKKLGLSISSELTSKGRTYRIELAE